MIKNYMPILLMILFALRLNAKNIYVNTVDELQSTISFAKAGDRIILEDGNYSNRVFYLRNDGEKERPIIIEAKNPGKAIFTGKSGFYIYGSHWIIKGLFFKDGQPTDELYTITHPAQYNIFVIYGDYIRITECAIHNFYPREVKRGRYISSEFGPKGFPQHLRIDHCSFICDERIEDGQFIAINNSFPSHLFFKHNGRRAAFFEKDNDYIDILKNYPDAIADAGQPLYARLDHNYFGVYGGSITRWGHYGDEFDLSLNHFITEFEKYKTSKPSSNLIDEKYIDSFKTWTDVSNLIPEKYRKKYRAWGGVIFDNNLVEGQRSGDAERICSKVGQNVYYNNTFYNDLGQLSLRAGIQEVIIDNFFLSDPSFSEAVTGKIVGWGQLHTVVDNYFRVNKKAGLTMTSGRDGRDTAHDTFAHGIIAYNVFEVLAPDAFSLDLRSKYDRRQALKTGNSEFAYSTVYGNTFKGNTFIHTNPNNGESYQFKYLYDEMIAENTWEDNYSIGAHLARRYKMNPQWHLMTPEQLRSIEKTELTNEIIKGFPGIETIDSLTLSKNKAGFYVNPHVERKTLKIKNLPTFPYSISELCQGKLVPIKFKGHLLPGVEDIDLSDFEKSYHTKRPLEYDEVGPKWLIGTLSKIGPKIRNYDTR
ncbi:MAG: hypothetical protein OXE55_05585 [Flavobacteriaceae bacterium]|nr:hypothetical protein [Flavobacteriaceae bacterium]MCY4254172.1 hypothetical protein [Flavobacteriaceae bacterium]